MSQVKVSWIKAKPRSEHPASNDKLFSKVSAVWRYRLSKGSAAPLGDRPASSIGHKKRQAEARLEERLTNCKGLSGLNVRLQSRECFKA